MSGRLTGLPFFCPRRAQGGGHNVRQTHGSAVFFVPAERREAGTMSVRLTGLPFFCPRRAQGGGYNVRQTHGSAVFLSPPSAGRRVQCQADSRVCRFFVPAERREAGTMSGRLTGLPFFCPRRAQGGGHNVRETHGSAVFLSPPSAGRRAQRQGDSRVCRFFVPAERREAGTTSVRAMAEPTEKAPREQGF